MKWWEDRVDEILIGLFITIISVAAILKGGENGMAVAGSAVSGMCVYVGSKVKSGGRNEIPPE